MNVFTPDTELATNSGALLYGNTETRGLAYGYNLDADGNLPANHFPSFVPEDRVRTELFGFEAVESPVFGELPATFETMTHLGADGSPKRRTESTTRKALLHSVTGEDLGVHGVGRKTFQYNDLLVDGTKALTGTDELGIVAAGTSQGGAKAWMQLESRELFKSPEGVEFGASIFTYSSHNGTWTPGWLLTSTLLKCTNEIPSIRRNGIASYSRKATSGATIPGMVESAHAALGLIHKYAETTSAGISELLQKETTRATFDAMVKLAFPSPADNGHVGVLTGAEATRYDTAVTKAENSRNALRALVSDDRCAPYFDDKGASSVFGLFNLLNTHRLWSSTVKGGEGKRFERNRDALISGKSASADNGHFALIEKAFALA